MGTDASDAVEEMGAPARSSAAEAEAEARARAADTGSTRLFVVAPNRGDVLQVWSDS